MTGATHKKIIVGFVVQTYADNKCIEQEFIGGDEVSYEDMDGDVLGIAAKRGIISREEYFPMHMVQPEPAKPEST